MNEILKFTAQKIKPCPITLIITPTQTILRLTREELTKQNQKLTQLQLIADSIPLHTCEKLSVLGPVIGKNAINLALAPLLVNQIQNVILISIAGAKDFKIGEILQGLEFIDEGRERYLANTSISQLKSAKVLSVSDPYTENGDFNGCDLIDMEASEIAKLCLKHKKSFYSIFCVSDTWEQCQWKHGFATENFQTGLKNSIRIGVEKALEI